VSTKPSSGARSIYQAYTNGDHLTDAEVAYGLQHFKQLETLAREAGPAFRIMAQEAGRVHDFLFSIKAARAR
jgi:hypothetical protein